jgi:hypothetical protein
VDWIGLAQDRDRRRAFVNSVLNLRVHNLLGNYRVSKQLGISRVVLSSMELVNIKHFTLRVLAHPAIEVILVGRRFKVLFTYRPTFLIISIGRCLQFDFAIIFFHTYTSTNALKKEAVDSSQHLIPIYRTV